MGKNMNNEGANLFARVMQKRMQDVGDAPPVLDLGTIQADGSLLTDNYPVPIPKSDYLICRSLTNGKKDEALTKTKQGQGQHDHSGGGHGGHLSGSGDHEHTQQGPHVHDVLIPEKLRSVKAGDRVLVSWIGSEAVVIDIVLLAKEAF